MSEKTERPLEAEKSKNGFVTIVRDEHDKAVAARIFLGQSLDGLEYHYFEFSRAYKPKNAKELKYTGRMFPRNAEAIARVATLAGKRCEELNRALNSPFPQETAQAG